MGTAASFFQAAGGCSSIAALFGATPDVACPFTDWASVGGNPEYQGLALVSFACPKYCANFTQSPQDCTQPADYDAYAAAYYGGMDCAALQAYVNSTFGVATCA